VLASEFGLDTKLGLVVGIGVDAMPRLERGDAELLLKLALN